MSNEIIIILDGSADAKTRLFTSDRASLISTDFYVISSKPAVTVVIGERTNFMSFFF